MTPLTLKEEAKTHRIKANFKNTQGKAHQIKQNKHNPYTIHGTGTFTYMNGWFFMVFM